MKKNRASFSDPSGMVCQKSILIYRMQLKLFYILKLLFLACLASHYHISPYTIYAIHVKTASQKP